MPVIERVNGEVRNRTINKVMADVDDIFGFMTT